MGPAMSCLHKNQNILLPINNKNPSLTKYISQFDQIQVPTHSGSRMSAASRADTKEGNFQQFNLVEAIERNDIDAVIDLINNYSLESWGDVSNYVTNNYRIHNPVETACNLGRTKIIHIFFDNGCSANLPTSSGRLIHTVCKNIQTQKINIEDGRELIKLMCLQNNCNVNIKDIHHKTPILYACEIGDKEILETLMSVSDPDILKCKDLPNGFTPLHMSTMKSDLECVAVILKHLPEKNFINIQDNRGRTPLHLSLISMCKNLQYMNEIALDFHELSESKKHLQREQTRKLQLIQENSISVVELLLLHGSDPNCYLHGGRLSPSQSIGKDMPLYLAMSLVANDLTADFLYGDKSKTSTAMQPFLFSSVPNNNLKPSSYSSLVRLLILFGANPKESKDLWLTSFQDDPSVTPLIEEVFSYIENKGCGPSKLFQLCKQVIRLHLTKSQNLHKIDELPLPTSMQAYIRFQFL
ncbi:ankyrin repeat and SOCS box protein 7-like [Saccostrea echinata]|uniref:ankyrin repeat and SOCS box protein 7-like n=1 Tax=Saccostrea echinata TaxID=191078 RepID=UPI002A7F86B3|nr:ankyrin repeat and SOCS box protein 7-like [Saccostrea echinata]